MSVSSETSNLIPTKYSILKKKKDVEIVNFKSHKPKQKDVKLDNNISVETSTGSNVFDIKKSRYEVMKFGMSGLEKSKKANMKVNLCIKLGAKPPKNKYVNYKELIAVRKKEKHEEREQSDFQQLGKNKLGKSNVKYNVSKRKKDSVQILDKYGKPSLKTITKKKNSK